MASKPDNSSEDVAAAAAVGSEPTNSRARPNRKKVLSFGSPNADFFVIDDNTPASGTRSRQKSYEGKQRRGSGAASSASPSPINTPELMGPILRRKKVVSMPLGDPRRNDFFYAGDRMGAPYQANAPVIPMAIDEAASATDNGSEVGHLPGASHFTRYTAGVEATGARARHRERQHTAPAGRGGFFQIESTGAAMVGTAGGLSGTRGRPNRKKTNSFMAGILARKAVGLDLLPTEEADLGVYEFFQPEEVVPEEPPILPEGLDHGEETKEEMEGEKTEEELVEEGESFEEEAVVLKPKVKLFKPLVFAPKVVPKAGAGGGHGHGGGHGGGGHAPAPSPVQLPEKKTSEKSERTETAESSRHSGVVLSASEAVPLTGTTSVSSPQKDADTSEEFEDEESVDLIEKYDDSHIIRATRKDYFYTAILFAVMSTLVGVVVGWHTRLDESDSIFGPVGLACKTPCRGDIYDQDYFRGQYTFATNDVLLLVPHIDTTLTEDSYLKLMIRGVETNQTKWESDDTEFGPASVEGERMSMSVRVKVDWENPEEPHVIDVISTTGSQQVPPPYYDAYTISGEGAHNDDATHTDDAADHTDDAVHRVLSSGTTAQQAPDVPHHGELTYNLYAATLHPIAGNSVLIAGLIMIFVYIFILLEVIHRTLVAIFGSLVALFFFFLMHGGHTESISTLMLHMEWSTLGLLFGMMLLVGELSHTGVFEWCAVRLLVASKGSFNRLMILLCGLVGLSSAFLDNVTTMVSMSMPLS
jgi:hypothetical protein